MNGHLPYPGIVTLRRWAAVHLDEPLEQATPIAGSIANRNLVLTTRHASFVLKLGTLGDVRAEAWACAHLSELGMPVPELVAAQDDDEFLGGPFTLTRVVAGRPLAEVAGAGARSSEAIVEAGRQLSRLHSVTGEGYGKLSAWLGEHAASGIPRAALASWESYVRRDLGAVDVLADAGVISSGLARRSRAALDGFEGWHEPGRLLHGDLKNQHVFLDDEGRLTAIIDWADSALGDPLYDLARYSMEGDDALQLLLADYGRVLDVDDRRRMALYRLRFSVSSLATEYACGGDWFDVYRNRILAAVDELGVR